MTPTPTWSLNIEQPSDGGEPIAPGDRWCSLWTPRGPCHPSIEGTADEWLLIAGAIEAGARRSFKRVAFEPLPDGGQFWSPRNSTGDHDNAKMSRAELDGLVSYIRAELAPGDRRCACGAGPDPRESPASGLYSEGGRTLYICGRCWQREQFTPPDGTDGTSKPGLATQPPIAPQAAGPQDGAVEGPSATAAQAVRLLDAMAVAKPGDSLPPADALLTAEVCVACEGDGEGSHGSCGAPSCDHDEPCGVCGGTGRRPTDSDIASLRAEIGRLAGDLQVAKLEVAAYQARHPGPHPFDDPQVPGDGPVGDAEARECVDRLGIDVPAWAADVRARAVAARSGVSTPPTFDINGDVNGPSCGCEPGKLDPECIHQAEQDARDADAIVRVLHRGFLPALRAAIDRAMPAPPDLPADLRGLLDALVAAHEARDAADVPGGDGIAWGRCDEECDDATRALVDWRRAGRRPAAEVQPGPGVRDGAVPAAGHATGAGGG